MVRCTCTCGAYLDMHTFINIHIFTTIACLGSEWWPYFDSWLDSFWEFSARMCGGFLLRSSVCTQIAWWQLGIFCGKSDNLFICFYTRKNFWVFEIAFILYFLHWNTVGKFLRIQHNIFPPWKNLFMEVVSQRLGVWSCHCHPDKTIPVY